MWIPQIWVNLQLIPTVFNNYIALVIFSEKNLLDFARNYQHIYNRPVFVYRRGAEEYLFKLHEQDLKKAGKCEVFLCFSWMKLVFLQFLGCITLVDGKIVAFTPMNDVVSSLQVRDGTGEFFRRCFIPSSLTIF